MKEVHSEEYGWSVSEPDIILNADKLTVTIKVHLIKYRVQTCGRSI